MEEEVCMEDQVCSACTKSVLYLVFEYARPECAELFPRREDYFSDRYVNLEGKCSNIDLADFTHLCEELAIGADDFDRAGAHGCSLFSEALRCANLPLIQHMHKERTKKFPCWFSIAPESLTSHGPRPNLFYTTSLPLHRVLRSEESYERKFAVVQYMLQEGRDLVNIPVVLTSFYSFWSPKTRSPLMVFFTTLDVAEQGNIFAKRLLALLLASGAHFTDDEIESMCTRSKDKFLAIDTFLNQISTMKPDDIVFPEPQIATLFASFALKELRLETSATIGFLD